jgi:hypothetical protein
VGSGEAANVAFQSRISALEAKAAAPEVRKPKEASEIAADIADFVSRKAAIVAESTAEAAAPHIATARKCAAAGASELSLRSAALAERAGEAARLVGPYYHKVVHPTLARVYSQEVLPRAAVATNASIAAGRSAAAIVSAHCGRAKSGMLAALDKHVAPAYEAKVTPLVQEHIMPLYHGTLLPFYRAHLAKHISAAMAAVKPVGTMVASAAAGLPPIVFTFVEKQRPVVAAKVEAARAGGAALAKASLLALTRAHSHVVEMAVELCGPAGERAVDWSLFAVLALFLVKMVPRLIGLAFRGVFFAAHSVVRAAVFLVFTLPVGIILFPFRNVLGTKPPASNTRSAPRNGRQGAPASGPQ